MTASRSRWPGPNLAEVPSEALLAAAALIAAVIELGGWLDGDGFAGIVLVVLLLMAGGFAGAARLRTRGRARDAAILGALMLLGAVPLFGLFYPTGVALVMVAPIAFVLVLPHVRGRRLLAFGLLASVTAVISVEHPVLPGVPIVNDAFSRVATAFGILATGTVLLLVTWRAYRNGETERARFERLVADLPVGVVRITPDNRFTEVNQAFVAIVGYPSREAVLATSVDDLYVNPDDEPVGRIEPDEQGLMSDQIRVRRGDGSEAWIRFRTREVTDTDGTVLWYDSEVEDVTVERSEREAQSRLAAILESVPAAVFAIGPDGRVGSWNHGAERIYGTAAAEMVGRDIFDVVRVAHVPRFRAMHRAVLDGQVVPPFDIEQTHTDGTTIIVSIGAAPVRDADGTVIAATIIARDITEERRLVAQQEELEAQLLQAQKMEAVGRLAGGIAHDFNNLLTAIAGFGGLVASELRGRQLEDQRQVLRAAERAADLTRRLLAFARRAPADPRPVAIDTVLEDAFRMVRRLVPERLELELELGAGRYVVGDPVEIEQVVLNLVLNAADATPDAGLIRLVTTAVDLDADFAEQHLGSAIGPHVLLTVSDTGMGMDEAVRARIFEPFFTTKDRGEGTGLGLATVYAIARRSGGTVWVDSEPGKGTTFRVYLPEIEAPAMAPAKVREEAPTGTGAVLLIEDEEAVRALVERILTRAGYHVFPAADPAHAATLLPMARPDVVVTDVIMPGMSGPDFVAGLPLDLPVVFMSGYTGGDATDLRLDLPTRLLVAKPFEPVTLSRAVRKVLDAAAAKPAQPATSRSKRPADADGPAARPVRRGDDVR